MTMTERWVEAAEAALDDVLDVFPEVATAVGDHRHDGRLTDLSDAGQAEVLRVVDHWRDKLDDLDPDDLDDADAVDLEVLRAHLDARAFQVGVLQERTRDPLLWLPGEALHPLLSREVLPPADRLRAVAARLAQVPDRLALARQTLRDVPQVAAETAAAQCAGVVRMVQDDVDRLLEREPSLRPRVDAARTPALAALDQHAAWLRDLATTAAGDPRLGPDMFAAKLHLALDGEVSAEQLRRAADARLSEAAEELERVASDWTGLRGADAVREALARVAADVPDDATIVPLAEQAVRELTEVVREHGFVEVPDDPVVVEVMPEHRRGVAVAYCDAPGALDEGGTTVYAISPTPAEWPEERVRSFYREYNRAMLVDLSAHEAVPGHVWQLAASRRYVGRTRVRKVLRSGTFVEGWAVHAEELVASTGFGGPAVRLMQLKMQMRMAANALLDAGVHAHGMTEGEAMDLMVGRALQEEGEAAGKWRRALLTSAQLSTYFAGWLALKPLVDARAGGSYDGLLAHGSPPPRHLPRLLGASGLR